MPRHDTPEVVAALLARFAPKELSRLLDPSVGSGVLVRPFLRKYPEIQLSCVDVDVDATTSLTESLRAFPNVKVIKANFLEWCKDRGEDHEFDCIVMNPPFAARKQDLVKLTRSLANGKQVQICVPMEVAFVYESLKLLRRGGRLLAVVPASVVATETGAWLREHLVASGAIQFVHELPPRTFAGVEGRMYLIVYEHGTSQSALCLRNHRLHKPDELKVPRSGICAPYRLDYAYHEAFAWYRSIRAITELGWTPLTDAVDFWRGEIQSPVLDDSVLHTSNLFDFHAAKDSSEEWLRPARFGDIVCKRVSRASAESFLPYYCRKPSPCSDCILVLRPKKQKSRLEILFALRVLLSSVKGAPLIEHGVSATYIPFHALQSLEIPCQISARYPRLFIQFSDLIARRKWKDLSKVEHRVRCLLDRRATGARLKTSKVNQIDHGCNAS